MPNVSVLIVDDNMDFCRLLGRLIDRLGYEAVCAMNGKEALTYLHDHVPHLVILDVMMPEMDGLDVLSQVRADPRLQLMPVIMFSALADPALRQRALSAGATDWWLKAAVDFSTIDRRLAPYLAATAQNAASDPAKA